MTFLHNPLHAVPFFIAAEVGAVTESWGLTLANYGVATTMLAWFMWRDKQDREDRKQEKVEQQKRHEENLVASRALQDALRTNTDSTIVGIAAMKTIDKGYLELLERMKESNSIDNGK